MIPFIIEIVNIKCTKIELMKNGQPCYKENVTENYFKRERGNWEDFKNHILI